MGGPWFVGGSRYVWCIGMSYYADCLVRDQGRDVSIRTAPEACVRINSYARLVCLFRPVYGVFSSLNCGRRVFIKGNRDP